MAMGRKYQMPYKGILRDARPLSVRMAEGARQPYVAFMVAGLPMGVLILEPRAAVIAEVAMMLIGLYFLWLTKSHKMALPLKMPAYAARLDPNNSPPGKSSGGKSEGILFLGNDKETQEELWVTNSDARTHILYLGTTGAGKTEGLKSLVTNTLNWGSGFVYIDGKADTDLWGSLYSLARRYGRDDDVLIINYMTGNSDLGSRSNTINPFATGSASYLTNLMTSLMDDAGDDNAMWKGRAIAMLAAIMPALTWKRDNQGLLLEVGVIRDHMTLEAIIRLSRDPAMPDRIVRGLQSYLDTLPGYVDEAFDDEGREVPMPPDHPPVDSSTCRQQHGYLSMQFTRSLQSLADEYGYIFNTQLADIDLIDVVLNRRILIVLIPALEKSADEAANLGKIVAASIKGMMGTTLGADVEGDWGSIIDNKQTRAPSPFMTVFDEVGYYTAQGMAVMAAQARSLGFSLVFAAQDLPAMEKRVKEEARSITGNCNIKIFGKLEDPTETREFFEKSVVETFVVEAGALQKQVGNFSTSYMDNASGNVQSRRMVSYDGLKSQREGDAHILFGDKVVGASMFFAVPDKVKALRVHSMLQVDPTGGTMAARDRAINEVARRLSDADWTALGAAAEVPTSTEISSLMFGFATAKSANMGLAESGAMSVASVAALLLGERSDDPASMFPIPTSPLSTGSAGSFGGGMAQQPSAPMGGMMPAFGEPPAASGLDLRKQDEADGMEHFTPGSFDPHGLFADSASWGGGDTALNPFEDAPSTPVDPLPAGMTALSPQVDAILRDAAGFVNGRLNEA